MSSTKQAHGSLVSLSFSRFVRVLSFRSRSLIPLCFSCFAVVIFAPRSLCFLCSLRSLGCLLGALWCLLGAFGCLLGAFWVLLGASWALLGSLGAFLGCSWGALGRSWGDLGAQVDFWLIFCPILVPTWLPKASQNGTKIDPKSDQKSMQKTKRKKSEIRPSWDRLGAILGRSWPHLGVDVGEKSLGKRRSV